MTTFKEDLKAIRQLVDKQLEIELPLNNQPENEVVKAMRYSTIGCGKALRPFLVMTVAKMFDVPFEQSIYTATALEMIHSYSLIHDDLPAMDNDDMRRGKLSCHKAFTEATAILAGDALLTQAFEILAQPHTSPNPNKRCELISLLASYAGKDGMIGGQMIDLLSEGDLILNQSDIIRLQSLKTGKLLSFACESGAILGNATLSERLALREYALMIGLAFQITDDILDVEGDEKLVGKTLQKDENAHKQTYLSLVGMDKAKEKAKELIDNAQNQLNIFGPKAESLKELAQFILERKY